MPAYHSRYGDSCVIDWVMWGSKAARVIFPPKTPRISLRPILHLI